MCVVDRKQVKKAIDGVLNAKTEAAKHAAMARLKGIDFEYTAAAWQEVREYDAAGFGGFIPLRIAAMLPFESEENAYRRSLRLMGVFLTAVIDSRIAAYDHETFLPLSELARVPSMKCEMSEVLGGETLLHVCDLSRFFRERGSPLYRIYEEISQDLHRRYPAANEKHNHAVDADMLHPRKETTYLNLIGAMLALFTSAKTPAGRRYADFESESAVIEVILAQFDGVPGLSTSNLQAKFASAKRSLKGSRISGSDEIG